MYFLNLRLEALMYFLNLQSKDMLNLCLELMNLCLYMFINVMLIKQSVSQLVSSMFADYK